MKAIFLYPTTALFVLFLSMNSAAQAQNDADILRRITYQKIGPTDALGLSGSERIQMSGDGSTIVLSTGSPKNVYTMKSDGSDVRQIFDYASYRGGCPCIAPFVDISTDGSKVIWTDGINEIFVADSDGSNQVIITPEYVNSFGTTLRMLTRVPPQLSADGTQISFANSPTGAEGRDFAGLWRVNADGSGQTQLADYPDISAGLFGLDGSEYSTNHAFRGGFQASDDGTRMIFGTGQEGGHVATYSDAGFRIIADEEPVAPGVTISGDGGMVAFNQLGLTGGPVFVMPFDGDSPTELIGTGANAYLHFTTDGSKLLVSEWGSSAVLLPITLVDTDGSGRLDLVHECIGTGLYGASLTTMSADGSQFAFEAVTNPRAVWAAAIEPEPSNHISLKTAFSGISEVRFDPPFTTLDGNVTSTFSARIEPDAEAVDTVCFETAQNGAFQENALGGDAPTQTMFDDATHGDVTAGDGIYTAANISPVTADTGAYTIRLQAVSASTITAVDAGPFSVRATGATGFVVNTASHQADFDLDDGICDAERLTPGEQCTLAAAVQNANIRPGVDEITFQIPGDGIPTISMNTSPRSFSIHEGVVLDGTTQSAGKVRILGHPEGEGCFVLGSGNSGTVIRGFVLNRCGIPGLASAAIFASVFDEGGGNLFELNCIGTDETGTRSGGDFANHNHGIYLGGRGGNTVRQNIISGNVGSGIVAHGTVLPGGPVLNLITDNKIGTDRSTTVDLGNGGWGISVFGSGLNTIEDNTISGNQLGGVYLAAALSSLEDNRIGTDSLGVATVGNSGPGIRAWGGGIVTSNVISANGGYGLEAAFFEDLLIESNFIGTDLSGDEPLGNGLGGMYVGGANKVIRSNIISGNNGDGIYGDTYRSHDIMIENNSIGTGDLDIFPLGNTGNGIFITNIASDFIIVDNFIGANGKNGIFLPGVNSFLIANNIVGGGPEDAGLGNGENGILLGPSFTNRITIQDNTISMNAEAGIKTDHASNNDIVGNVIQSQMVGVDMIFSANAIRNNFILFNEAGIVSNVSTENSRIEGNVIISSGTSTGIRLDAASALIRGNMLTDDAGDAIRTLNGAEATVTKNNIFNNAGLGLNNMDPSVVINAESNWWGDASGPGGSGPGSGDAVSQNVVFDNWLAVPVAVLVSTIDTVVANIGGSGMVPVGFQNWATPGDVLDVTITDAEGWLGDSAPFNVTLNADSGAVVDLAYAVPDGTADNIANQITVVATSRSDVAASDTSSFIIRAYGQTLVDFLVTPDSVVLTPGSTRQFAAVGFDQFNQRVALSPVWTATGGEIDEDGLFVADSTIGTFLVTATDPVSGLVRSAVVFKGTSVANEDDEASVPKAFELYQNYPNPFNPTTRIEYTVPVAAHVNLTVYDLLGRRVAQLVNETVSQGRHSTVWHAQDVGSGIYFYRLEAADFSETRSMFVAR